MQGEAKLRNGRMEISVSRPSRPPRRESGEIELEKLRMSIKVCIYCP